MVDQQSPVNGVALSMGFAPSKTADGQYFVAVMVQYGITAYQFALPLETADEQADQIAEKIKAAAAEARRQKSGLVIAGNNGSVAHFPKHGRKR